MIPKFFVLTLIAVATLSGAVVAQDDNGTDVNINTGNQSANDCRNPETIDNITQLCSATLSEDGDRATLVFKSKIPQRIILTDAGGFMEGGVVHQKTVPMQSGRNRVTFRVTTVDGFSGVSVATNEVLFAVPLEKQSSLIGGPFGASDVQISALGGAASVAFSMVVITIRTLTGKRDSPERVA